PHRGPTTAGAGGCDHDWGREVPVLRGHSGSRTTACSGSCTAAAAGKPFAPVASFISFVRFVSDAGVGARGEAPGDSSRNAGGAPSLQRPTGKPPGSQRLAEGTAARDQDAGREYRPGRLQRPGIAG